MGSEPAPPVPYGWHVDDVYHTTSNFYRARVLAPPVASNSRAESMLLGAFESLKNQLLSFRRQFWSHLGGAVGQLESKSGGGGSGSTCLSA